MGRNRYKIYETHSPHFLTCTIVNWVPIFTRPDTVQIVLDSWHFLQQEHQVKIYAYVILENHLHWVAQSDNLSVHVSRFKSFTARCIIGYLTQHEVHKILEQLKFRKKSHKEDRTYQVWQEGSHPQLLQNDEMLIQKIKYIHENPVKRGYVDLPEHWRYSSARNYAGKTGLLEVYTQWV